MKIAIATTQVPFISGGAELMIRELSNHLNYYGHIVDVITVPFIFREKTAINENMKYWSNLNFNNFDIGHIDLVICTKFPSYYLQHPSKIVWLAHQHRSVYDLWDTPLGDASTDQAACKLKNEIIKQDQTQLSTATKIFTISKTVSARLKKFNNIKSEPLYQPSPLTKYLGRGEQLPYILCPSRLEGLKRQELLIRAVTYCKTPCSILIVGTGTMYDYLNGLITHLNLNHKVKLLGYTGEQELANLYRNALSVFFAPYDEDYGFVTIEAMQCSKPIITCTDSGGPLEFVQNNETGFIVDPSPEAIAEKIDELYLNRKKAKDMGLSAFEQFCSWNLNWENVVNKLVYRYG